MKIKTHNDDEPTKPAAVFCGFSVDGSRKMRIILEMRKIMTQVKKAGGAERMMKD